MTKQEIKNELTEILDRLRINEDVHLLADVISECDYTVRDVHGWAGECREDKDIMRIYNKIRDILESRIFKGINNEMINPQLGMKTLGEFFTYSEGKEGGIVINILHEGAEL